MWTDKGKEFTALQGLKENNPDIFQAAHQTRLDELTGAKEKHQRLAPFVEMSPLEIKLEAQKKAIQERLIKLNESVVADNKLLAETVSNSRAHLVTDFGLLMEANKNVLPVKIWNQDIVIPRV